MGKKQKLEKEIEVWTKAKEPEICPLCLREISASQRDKHHLVPKLKGGKETQYLHRICHRQIHALFSEAELAKRYNSVEALLKHEEISKFVKWVSTKPIDFIEQTKESKQKR